MKKVFSLFLSLVMLISVATMTDFNAFADTYSGTCGTNVKWSLNTSTGVLTLSGSGKMNDYESFSTPWDRYDSYIKTVNISNGIESIGNSAFSRCTNLASVSISNSVMSIGEYAFFECSSLKSITIPNSVEYIGNYAFHYCKKLSQISLSKNLKSIGCGVFLDTAYYEHLSNWTNNVLYLGDVLLTADIFKISGQVNIIPGTKVIADCAFEECDRITSVSIPDTVKYIGNSAFEGCTKLSSLIIGNSVTHIGNMAFIYTDFKTITMPESVTRIGEMAFYGSSLDSIKILNKNCIIYDDVYTLGASVIIYGYPASTAQAYAKKYKDSYTFRCVTHTYKSTTTKATTKKNGSKVTKCTVCGAKKSTTTIYYPKTISLSATSYTYDGKVKKPSVTVKDSKGKKIAASNYTVTYASGRKNVGTYKVTIKFKGNYNGTATKTFKINPKATSFKSVTSPKKKTIGLKWGKVSSISGYQVQCSTSSKFNKNVKTNTAKASSSSASISKSISSKKTYYVRIRTYKTVNGTKYYSSWSKIKSIKTK